MSVAAIKNRSFEFNTEGYVSWENFKQNIRNSLQLDSCRIEFLLFHQVQGQLG